MNERPPATDHEIPTANWPNVGAFFSDIPTSACTLANGLADLYFLCNFDMYTHLTSIPTSILAPCETMGVILGYNAVKLNRSVHSSGTIVTSPKYDVVNV